jgi:FtsH-binding integral membrane protein
MEHTLYDRTIAARAEDTERQKFIKKTYLHLAGAILAFAGLEYIALKMPFVPKLTAMMTGGYGWLVVLGAFMGISWLANSWAHSNSSKGMQYAGLALYIVGETVIFIPLLYIAQMYAGPDLIMNAGIITLLLFAGLTYVALTSKKDFSFLGGALKIGFFVALGVIILSIAIGFTLGLIFSAIMAVLAAGAILYTTSNILHEYNTDQYVAASLSLFASVALLFWYIIQILLSLSRD